MSEGDKPAEQPRQPGKITDGGVDRLPAKDGSRAEALRKDIVAKLLRKPALTAKELASEDRDENN